MPLTSLKDLLLGRRGSKIGTGEVKLPDSVLKHNSIDELRFERFVDSSPRFREVAVEDAPPVPTEVEKPELIDMTKATPEEFLAYRDKLRAYEDAQRNAPRYLNWEKLTRDMFYSYHTRERPELVEEVDPGVELHKRILPKAFNTEDHALSRNMTRGDGTIAAVATMKFVSVLKEILGEELKPQAQAAQQYEQEVREAEQIIDDLEDLREDARDHIEQGLPVPDDIVDQIKALVRAKRAAQGRAVQAAAHQPPMDLKAVKAIEQAAKEAHEAAESAGSLPHFGQGFGEGEPVYESPEQALSIAEMWAKNPNLRKMAELFGRMDKDIRFQRSTRVVGGQDEIVDVEFGDNLARVLPSELATIRHPKLRLEFLARYADQELLQFSTVGEEHAGRGPIVVVLDGSASMRGERNIWARALAMCWLHIARLEKRDFAAVEFAHMNRVESWLFPAKKPMQAQDVVDMASHFFGGGTAPVQGMAGAAKLMDESAPFRKADIVLIGDGEADFGSEDKRLRDHLKSKGVRIWGVAIGESNYRYLTEYCEAVVHVHDFELTDPSEATAALATHIT